MFANPEVSAVRLSRLAHGAPLHVLGEVGSWSLVAGAGYVRSAVLESDRVLGSVTAVDA